MRGEAAQLLNAYVRTSPVVRLPLRVTDAITTGVGGAVLLMPLPRPTIQGYTRPVSDLDIARDMVRFLRRTRRWILPGLGATLVSTVAARLRQNNESLTHMVLTEAILVQIAAEDITHIEVVHGPGSLAIRAHAKHKMGLRAAIRGVQFSLPVHNTRWMCQDYLLHRCNSAKARQITQRGWTTREDCGSLPYLEFEALAIWTPVTAGIMLAMRDAVGNGLYMRVRGDGTYFTRGWHGLIPPCYAVTITSDETPHPSTRTRVSAERRAVDGARRHTRRTARQ